MYWLHLFLIDGISNTTGGVLEDVLNLKNTFCSPWLEGQVLGLEALSPRKLPCPRLEDSTIFWTVKMMLENARNLAENLRRPFLFSSFEDRLKIFLDNLFFFFRRTLAPVFLASRGSVLGLVFFCVLGLEPCVFVSIALRFSKCSVRSPRAPLKKPRVSASHSFTFLFYFRNLQRGSVNNGQPFQRLHNTKSLRTRDIGDRGWQTL